MPVWKVLGTNNGPAGSTEVQLKSKDGTTGSTYVSAFELSQINAFLNESKTFTSDCKDASGAFDDLITQANQYLDTNDNDWSPLDDIDKEEHDQGYSTRD